jgi:7,8-dihydropterin-6-yl-methyl-4-(beta-D-ribofuranosyl)aminobenzene 5'-phosphate synthase
MTFTITTLAENSVPQGAIGLLGEHGQSFYVETGEKRILFDVGQGLVLSNNARCLGIDLKRVDTVILSHGHNDHTGGLKALTAYNSSFTLFADPAAFFEKFVKSEGEIFDRGISVEAAFLEKIGVRLRLDTQPAQIAPGVSTTGEIPMETDFESLEPVFFTKENGATIPDLLPDDRALVLDTEKGLVILLGCTHRGIINTLRHVRRLTGKENIHAVIGGLHLGKADEEKLTAIIESLRAFEIDRIGVGHCTGMRAAKRLMDAFGDRVFLNAVGKAFRF